MSPKRVVICDDHEIVREALKNRMAESTEVEIVGEAADGVAVVDTVRELMPDVLVLDVELPERDGINALEEIRAASPETRVLLFTAHAQPELVGLGLRAGASGFVLKSAPAEDVVDAVEAVASGETYVGGQMADEAARELERLLSLSARERQILELLARGMRARAIAEHLGLRPATVHTHVRNTIVKLEVETRTQAVALAVKYDFLESGSIRLPDPEDEEGGAGLSSRPG